MAIGINYEAATGGDFLPIVKFDCRSGRMFRLDRPEGGGGDQVDITREFKAVFDFENLETGFISFETGSAPDFSVVKLGTGTAPRPSDKHKPGIRMLVKLGGECSGGHAAIRELATNAKAALRGIDMAHDAYLAGMKLPENAGKLPVMIIDSTTAIVTEGGNQKSTNYAPVFKIVAWVPRPSDLKYSPRAATTSGSATPASTGSTRADPPAQQAASVEEDFG